MPTQTVTQDPDIKLYVELQNVSNFKQDTNKLKSIVDLHVASASDSKVKVITYYRPLKLASKFSTRIRPQTPDKSCCVYQFQCSEQSCHDVKYIGYTNQRLATRVKQHRYKTSSIYKHYFDVHNDIPPKFSNFIESFTIIYKGNDILPVKIAEAILIKHEKPVINVKYNELYDFLRLF